MRGRIRNVLGDVLFVVILAVAMYGVLSISEEKVCSDEKECLTLYDN